MGESDLTGQDFTILEIVATQPSVHTLNVLNQVKQMTAISGGSFDQNEVTNSLNKLQGLGYVTYLADLDSWKITPEGKDII